MPSKKNNVILSINQVICTIIKIILIIGVCYYLTGWVSEISTLSDFLKSFLLWSFRLLPILLFLVMFIDPGYVLDHEIQEGEYEQTDDKKRPKDGKYCEYCKLFVNRKTGHCFQCHHCVSNFDHHCGIMARCVGKTNVFLFYGFVILANVIYMGMIMLVFYKFVIVSKVD